MLLWTVGNPLSRSGLRTPRELLEMACDPDRSGSGFGRAALALAAEGAPVAAADRRVIDERSQVVREVDASVEPPTGRSRRSA
jgi:hypothetical protein